MSLFTPRDLGLSGKGLRFAIVAARFNSHWVDELLRRCTDALTQRGVAPSDIAVVRVPGSHEVPWTVSRLAAGGDHDVIIALGVLLKGSTNHHELVATAVANSLLSISVQHDVPVINGVMAVDTEQQAVDRCGERLDRGSEFAQGAIEMALLNQKL